MSDAPNAAPEQRIDPIIAEYLEAVERGGRSDPGYWIARYPDLADELEARAVGEDTESVEPTGSPCFENVTRRLESRPQVVAMK